MVWSTLERDVIDESAEKCFGCRWTELKAVWGRNELGISKAVFYDRVPTVKPLEKPCIDVPELSEHSAASTGGQRMFTAPNTGLCVPEYKRTIRNISMRVRHNLNTLNGYNKRIDPSNFENNFRQLLHYIGCIWV